MIINLDMNKNKKKKLIKIINKKRMLKIKNNKLINNYINKKEFQREWKSKYKLLKVNSKIKNIIKMINLNIIKNQTLIIKKALLKKVIKNKNNLKGQIITQIMMINHLRNLKLILNILNNLLKLIQKKIENKLWDNNNNQIILIKIILIIMNNTKTNNKF
jgi:hypothetical protein